MGIYFFIGSMNAIMVPGVRETGSGAEGGPGSVSHTLGIRFHSRYLYKEVLIFELSEKYFCFSGKIFLFYRENIPGLSEKYFCFIGKIFPVYR